MQRSVIRLPLGFVNLPWQFLLLAMLRDVAAIWWVRALLLAGLLCAFALLVTSCASTTAPGQDSTVNPYSQLLQGVRGPQEPVPLGSMTSSPSTASTPNGAAKTGANSER